MNKFTNLQKRKLFVKEKDPLTQYLHFIIPDIDSNAIFEPTDGHIIRVGGGGAVVSDCTGQPHRRRFTCYGVGRGRQKPQTWKRKRRMKMKLETTTL